MREAPQNESHHSRPNPADRPAIAGQLRRTNCVTCFACLVAAAMLTGCQETQTRFELISFRDPNRPEVLTETDFQPGAFSINARRNYDIVLESRPQIVPVAPAAADTESADLDEPEASQLGIRMTQLIHIEIFWNPRPGTTFAESSQTNANITYCVTVGSEAVSYEGAGFVYIEMSRDGTRIEGWIESATLAPARPRARRIDPLGQCRLTGCFTAVESRRRVIEVQKRLRRLLDTGNSHNARARPAPDSLATDAPAR